MIIEETGVVSRYADGVALVETRRGTVCGSCQASAGCGSGMLQRLAGRRWSRVEAVAPFPVRTGERVVLGLDAGALIRGSLLLYGTPLAGLFLGALSGVWLGGADYGDWPAVTGAAVGLWAGFVWVRRRHALAGKASGKRRYQPYIIRRDGNIPAVSVVLTK